jgi:hypothetical protein
MCEADNLRVEPASEEFQSMNHSCRKERIITKDWLQEYAPKTPADLVLQKPKLDQLNAWLQIASKRVGTVKSCPAPLFYHFINWVWKILEGTLGFSLLHKELVFNPLHSCTYGILSMCVTRTAWD